MNLWPVYNYIKNQFFETGRFPTNWEIAAALPEATFEEIREGRIEAEIQYKREWRHYSPDVGARRQRA